jgi:hypothetical protein
MRSRRSSSVGVRDDVDGLNALSLSASVGLPWAVALCRLISWIRASAAASFCLSMAISAAASAMRMRSARIARLGFEFRPCRTVLWHG